jgi:hypothetical protein
MELRLFPEERAMSEQKLTEQQLDQIHFMSLVQTYQQMAWVALGKLASPVSGKVERDLAQAQWAIDLLAMLQRRTKGNLAAEEDRMLGQILFTLRMNYVDERNRPPEPETEAAAPPEPEAAPAAGDAAPEAEQNAEQKPE